MMLCVSHVQINNGQGHEDKGLQGDDEDVKHRPRPLQHTAEQRQNPAAAEHQRNQDEDHFAGVHVAE